VVVAVGLFALVTLNRTRERTDWTRNPLAPSFRAAPNRARFRAAMTTSSVLAKRNQP
jgi:hypothetical protein